MFINYCAGTEEHARHPRAVEALLGKRVTDVAVGICHAVVCTEDGEVSQSIDRMIYFSSVIVA